MQLLKIIKLQIDRNFREAVECDRWEYEKNHTFLPAVRVHSATSIKNSPTGKANWIERSIAWENVCADWNARQKTLRINASSLDLTACGALPRTCCQVWNQVNPCLHWERGD